MARNLRDQWWVLDADDHSELATAFRASLDVDVEGSATRRGAAIGVAGWFEAVSNPIKN